MDKHKFVGMCEIILLSGEKFDMLIQIQPKIYKDLFHSYSRGADRIWAVNVADIKPMEYNGNGMEHLKV